MCLLAIYHQLLPDAPLLLAANREEFFDRPATNPRIQPGSPGVLCGIDQRAGGTWLGVNAAGVVVAVTNRPLTPAPAEPRSRGLLCRALLERPTAAAAARQAADELASGRYAGANFLLADAQSALVVSLGERVEHVSLDRGLHLLTNGRLDDADDARQNLARELFAGRPIANVDDFQATARGVCCRGPVADDPRSIIIRTPQRGTVSSTVVVLTQQPADARYWHAAGAPDQTPYVDYSAELRSLLAPG